MTMRLRPSLHLALLAMAIPASAQSFNVDIGPNTVYPVPGSTYGAAASQPGTWNGVSASIVSPVSLTGLSGSATAVTLSTTGGMGNYGYDNPLTTGDDDSLMDDSEDLGGPGGSATWTFQGLANGAYEVTTYAWASDDDTYRTVVSVAGSSDSAQTVGGAWPGVQTLGVTCALHHVTVSSGTLSLTATTAGNPSLGFGTLNGFQIKQAASPPIVAYCFGDGSAVPCPCNNNGLSGRGCQNSGSTGGARVIGSGNPTLSSDTFVLSLTGEMPTALTIILQGSTNIAPVAYGDGLRCTGGNLKRLYAKSASGGALSVPGPGDLSVSARSSLLGDTIAPGATRYYNPYYRDGSASFCPAPTGATFNSSNALIVHWN